MRIIRRFNDEVISTYHGPDESRRRRENRGNNLLVRFLKGRYPNVMKNESDERAVFQFLNISVVGEERTAIKKSKDALANYTLDFILENDDLRQRLIHLLISRHFYDVRATHVAPLQTSEFKLPEPVDFSDLNNFLNSFERL